MMSETNWFRHGSERILRSQAARNGRARVRSILVALGAISVFLPLTALLPGTATALPSNYEIDRGLLVFDISYETETLYAGIFINGGSFSYDAETNSVGDLTLLFGEREIDLGDSIALSGWGGIKKFGDGDALLGFSGLGYEGDSGTGPLDSSTNSVGLIVKASILDTIGSTSGPSIVEPIGSSSSSSGPSNAVPEPGAGLLFAAGLVTAGVWARRESRRFNRLVAETMDAPTQP